MHDKCPQCAAWRKAYDQQANKIYRLEAKLAEAQVVSEQERNKNNVASADLRVKEIKGRIQSVVSEDDPEPGPGPTNEVRLEGSPIDSLTSDASTIYFTQDTTSVNELWELFDTFAELIVEAKRKRTK